MPGVKKNNHRDGGNAKRRSTPADAPSVRRTEGPRAGYGVFRQDVPVLSKNWPHPCGHPTGFPPPARRCHTGTPRARAKARSSSVFASTRPPSPRRGRKSEAKAKADAKRGSALSPLRFGRVAQRLGVLAMWPPTGVPPQPSSSARAYPSTMLRALALKAIFFGLLFFWASKRKVTRAAAADRNARRVGGQVTEALQKNSQRCRDKQEQSHWMTSLRLLKSASCLRRNDERGSLRPLKGLSPSCPH